ncbi:PadR family transcriptional regulator [uncultured Aeromicrobium sp.]|uniref:PadR family transcriptional regulator n=1 Tax=uncultured Aeromicrobium sp. TaxID=337820 RepID=UPI0025F544C7|nr:helix-turn-helix transcriptional regulator [uncultured Aeromicrobium sp.]
MGDGQVWPVEWVRAVLPLAVLRAIETGATYGYAIAARLEQSGLGTVKGGTLYPLLGRLQDAELLEAEWRAGEGGPGRKHYELTAAGRRMLRDHSERWERFTSLMQSHLLNTTKERDD